MGSKKNKVKKVLSPQSAPVEDTVDDDALMDDLLAQLDSKDDTVRKESATVLNEMQINKVADQLDSAPKKDSKARYKARQVCCLPSFLQQDLKDVYPGQESCCAC